MYCFNKLILYDAVHSLYIVYIKYCMVLHSTVNVLYMSTYAVVRCACEMHQDNIFLYIVFLLLQYYSNISEKTGNVPRESVDKT